MDNRTLSRILGAGEINRLISIQVNTPTPHAVSNEPIDSWDTLANVWAKVEGERASEKPIADKESVRQTAVFTVYYRGDVTEENRITYNEKIWDITSIVENGYQKYLEIRAEWQGLTLTSSVIGSGFSSGFSPGFK